MLLLTSCHFNQYTTMNTLSVSTEIRKLSAVDKLELVRLLHENWKILMSKIPEKLEKENYESAVRVDNPPKYNSSDIRLVEQASITDKRLPCDILFEEWGSSGRVRPALGHLFYILQECKLYAAADYVAKILRKNSPQRPNYGPAAKVMLTPEERKQLDSSNVIIPNNIRCPSIVMESNTSDESNFSTQNTSNVDLVLNNHVESPRVSHTLSSVSDMIQWSSEQMPHFSSLLKSENETLQSSVNDCIPHLSTLLDEARDANYPNLSMLDDRLPVYHTSHENSNLPDFDALRSNSSLTESRGGISIPQISRSPLPSLSLNTLLKHYPYAELEIATNYFNEMPYVSAETEGSSISCGRLLGSGAFSSVYLAFGLIDKPIAVKRLNLKNINIITKQFATEVETFYKYKHDHLVPLLGYSCDGMAYCLLYEYIEGGNLTNKLQCTENGLNWKERFGVAMGTADAVAYLHTASSQPLVHRDIKSANILLNALNQPKLCDFGIIRIATSTTTGTNQILGTSAYMPPEAHRGDVSVKMDTYSFGVVLLELITGLPPVDYDRNGNDIVTYVQDYLEDEGDISSLLDPKAGTWEKDGINYGNELNEIAMKCLQERKNVRPTMVDVKNELLKLMKNMESKS